MVPNREHSTFSPLYLIMDTNEPYGMGFGERP